LHPPYRGATSTGIGNHSRPTHLAAYAEEGATSYTARHFKLCSGDTGCLKLRSGPGRSNQNREEKPGGEDFVHDQLRKFPGSLSVKAPGSIHLARIIKTIAERRMQ
jgi:hypothetical protein